MPVSYIAAETFSERCEKTTSMSRLHSVLVFNGELLYEAIEFILLFRRWPAKLRTFKFHSFVFFIFQPRLKEENLD